MATALEPSTWWRLRNGRAWIFPSGSALMRPVILVPDMQSGRTDLVDFVARLDHGSYSFLSALAEKGLDVVVVGSDGSGDQLADLAGLTTECLKKVLAERKELHSVAVGGFGRGAVVARYSLVELENQRFPHQAEVYVSCNGAAPSADEAQRLSDLGGWPRYPTRLKAVSGDFKDELSNNDFYDTWVGPPNSGGALLTPELGNWILERLL